MTSTKLASELKKVMKQIIEVEAWHIDRIGKLRMKAQRLQIALDKDVIRV